jgi:uncharacterized membrane protein
MKVKTTEQSRWKSPVLWTAIISLILLILKLAFNVQYGDEISSQATTYILTIISFFGIINSPTSRNKL